MENRYNEKRRILIGCLKGPKFARITFSKYCTKETICCEEGILFPSYLVDNLS